MTTSIADGPPKASPAVEVIPGVWLVKHWHQAENSNFDYLVTEPGDVNRLVAFVKIDTAIWTMDVDEADGLWRARAIAEAKTADERSLQITVGDIPVIDLRSYGRADSMQPVPGFIWSLVCWPIDDEGKEIERSSPCCPRPPCPFMLSAINAGKVNPALLPADGDGRGAASGVW